MTPQELLDMWAPAGARWTEWAKPVLFASLPAGATAKDPKRLNLAVALAPFLEPPGAAVVVDLPGSASVRAGTALAAFGYRPVPLFNALVGDSRPLVDVASVQQALVDDAEAVRAAGIAADAPPAFLLDALRGTGQRSTEVQSFDNRSLSFCTDFPSASVLRAHGVERVILLRRWYLVVPGDLVDTLAAWHAAGIEIQIHDVDGERPAVPWQPPGLLWLRRFWFRMLAPLALRRQRSGAFGGIVSAGG